MYRKSSKGNPYHDAKGRFTSADAVGERETKMWSSFGEQHDADTVLKKVNKASTADIEKAWTTLDSKRTKVATTDGRRHYHNQSIHREDVAKEIANYKLPKGYKRAERKKMLTSSMERFKEENKIALKHGGKIVPFYKGNESQYQIIESNRMSSEVTKFLGNKNKKKESITINTSTHMKQFSGFTVEFYGGNTVRSCRKGASPAEISAGISKFCSKHKKDLSDKNVCIKVWRDQDRVYFMPVYSFKTEEEAKKFAEGHPKARIVNHDDKSMA